MASFNIGGLKGGGASAGKGCGGGCGAVFGVIIGLLLIPVGFYLAYHAEAKLVNHGKVFEAVEMTQPDAARAMEGELVKIQGQAQGEFLSIDEWDGEALYYHRLIEQYEEERDSEGEVSRSWRTSTSQDDWVSSFTLDGVEVRPGGAHPVGKQEVYSAYRKHFETGFHVGTDRGSPEVGDQRKSVNVLDATKSVIVLGQMSNGSIQGGSTFVVSTQNDQQTTQTLKTEYATTKWAMRAGAVFLIFFGIMAVFGPLTTLVGYIPIVGNHLSCAFAGIAFVFALVSVTAVTIFVNAFWILVAVAAIGIAFMIYRGVTTPREGPGGGAPGGPDQPAPPTQPTPAGTTESQAGTSSTLPPGAGAGVPRPSEPPRGTEPADDVGPPSPAETPAERAATSEFMRPAEPDTEIPEAGEDTSTADRAAASAFMRPAEPSEDRSEDAIPKFCSACGAGLDPSSKFCRECGKKV